MPATTLLVHVHNRKRIQFNLSGIYPMLPLGIAVLGAELERAGLPVDLLDLSLPAYRGLDVAAKVGAGGYDLVGLSATVFSLPETIRLAADIRRAAPRASIAVGGPATIFEPEVLARYLPDADVFVFGEGERSVVALARGGTDPANLAAIPGIAYRENGSLRRNPDAGPLEMDELARPARHLLPRGVYTMHPPFARFPPITLVETARGCPFRCAFCSLPKTWRARSVPRVLEELREVAERDGVREVHFIDPTFTADPDRALDLARAIEPLNLRFTFKTRVDRVDPGLLAAMRRAGCYLISYGIESLSGADLEYLDKGGTAGLGVARLRDTKAAGIDALAYMLVGNPEDDARAVVRSTRRLIGAGCDFALFSGLFPDPATPITQRAIERGWVTTEQVHELYFRQVRLPGDRGLSGHPAARVKRWVVLSFLLFYFSPRTLWRIARRPRNYREFGRIASAALHLVADLLWRSRTV